MKRLALLAIGLVLALGSADASAASEVDTLVVCPDAWRDAMRPWVALREEQGRSIRFVPAGSAAKVALAAAVKEHASVDAVVLVGDAPIEGHPATANQTPTGYAPAVINRRWGSAATMASDARMLPGEIEKASSLAIGRIPATSLPELQGYLRRVLAYEQSRGLSVDAQRVTIVAAPGRFSPLLDRLIENTAANMLAQLMPLASTVHLTYANWRSACCPYPLDFSREVVRGLSQPAAAWIYMGHGHYEVLDELHTPQGAAPILDRSSLAGLQAGGPPVAAFVACYTGAFDQPQPCLAESLVMHPHGPVAVIAGSRVTMPYGNSRLGMEMLDGLFGAEVATVGEVVRRARERVLRDDAEPLNESQRNLRSAIEMIAAGLTPKEDDRRQERLEHVLMYNLLGDPLLRVRRPTPLVVEAERNGRSVRVRFDAPHAGECCIRLLTRAGHLRTVPRERFVLSDEARTDYQQQYAAANNSMLAEWTLDVERGPVTRKVALPEDLPDGAVLCVYVNGVEGAASGGCVIVR